MPNFQTAIITHIKQQLKTEKKVEQVLWICGNIIMKFSRQEKPANDTEIHVINVDELGSQIPKPKFKKSLFSFSPVFRLVLCFPLWTLNRKSECFHEFLRSDLSIDWAAGVYIVPVVALFKLSLILTNPFTRKTRRKERRWRLHCFCVWHWKLSKTLVYL